MAITKARYGQMPDGQDITVFTMSNPSGVCARVINYGAILISLETPDRHGAVADIVLGYDSLDGWLRNEPYLGATIGRHGNRIARGRFRLNDVEYQLATNNGPNHLHGGLRGFDKVIWTAVIHETKTDNNVIFSYVSPDGEENYPGTLSVSVTYTLTNTNELKITYQAETDKTTIINLTNHSYFNLAGQGNGDILSHLLAINADQFLPTDETAIPLAEPASVAGTPFDFRQSKPIGRDIEADHQQLAFGKGYDHCFILNKTSDELSLAARAEETSSGRIMEVYTTEPGVQLYTGNYLDGTITGKAAKVYRIRNGFCLETQHFPDSPNRPDFPSTILNPGDTFSSTTVYKFMAK